MAGSKTDYNVTLSDSLSGTQNGVDNPQWYTGGIAGTVTSYVYDLYNLIWSAETSWSSNRSSNPFSLENKPTVVEGHPTIGIGNDLVKNSGVLSNYFGVAKGSALYGVLTATYKSTDDLENALSKIGESNWSITAAQSQAAWASNVTHFESAVDGIFSFSELPGQPADKLPLSTERIAFVDMAFNGVPLEKSTTLRKDIGTGDRADAWFQIAFNSNNFNGSSANGGAAGNATRRLEDASLFGLYSPGTTAATLSTTESMDVYSMLSGKSTNASKTLDGMTNRVFAFNYSALWQANLSQSNLSGQKYGKTNTDIDQQLIAQDLPALQRGDLRDNLSLAASNLVSHFVLDGAINPYMAAGMFTAAMFDALDVQVATKNGGDTLSASLRNGYFLNQGNYQTSLLIARDGNDTLDGEGTANNVLVGGSGNDVMYIGSGNDYIVAGSGDALITGGSGDGPIGSGNDTIVLGDSDKVGTGGHHTVMGGAGDDTYYVSRKNTDVIKLGVGGSEVRLVDDATKTSTLLSIQATAVGSVLGSNPFVGVGTYLDRTSSNLVLTSRNEDNTKDLRILSLPEPPLEHTQSLKMRSLEAASSWDDLANGIETFLSTNDFEGEGLSGAEAQSFYDTYAGSDGQASDATGGILEIDGYTGNNVQGIQLTDAPVVPNGENNLSQLELGNLHPNQFDYYDFNSAVTSVFAGDADPGSRIMINGEGNAKFIQAGNGTQSVFIFDAEFMAITPLSEALHVEVRGGTGNQTLVGMGTGTETITGGLSGVDTSTWTEIDGGGADGLLSGGGQNSIIWGGTGQDTLIASAADEVVSPDFNPASILVAGQSFWGNPWAVQNNGGVFESVTSLPLFSIEASADVADFQLNVSLLQPDATFGPYIGFLGSEYDPAVASGDSSIPGSLVIGASGLDFLIGNVGDDTLIGGTPSDSQPGALDELLSGGAGSDVIYAGEGTEVIFADISPGASASWSDDDSASSDTIYGGSGSEYIYGSGGDDVIHGGSGNYTIYTGNGNAYVETGTGSSIVHGGNGNDFIVAGSGADSIDAGDGDTYVYAGDGESTVVGGAGDDTLEAGEGSTIYYAGSGSSTFIVGGAGGDQWLENASDASEVTIRFMPDVDSGNIVARRGTDGALYLQNQLSGRVFVVDGYFSGDSANASINLKFADGTIWGASQILASTMTAGLNDGTLIGTAGNDTIVGGIGNTVIYGEGGNNILSGGDGDASIIGGDGSDLITGGSGNTVIFGGSGQETYVFGTDSGSETISLWDSSVGDDHLVIGEGIDRSDVSFLRNATGSDLVIRFGDATQSDIVVEGFFRDDDQSHHLVDVRLADGSVISVAEITADAGSTYVSDNGNDSIGVDTGDNVLHGGSGSDTLSGGSGNDTLIGGSGYEVLLGGAGHSMLIGGSGHDTIIAGAGGDFIDAGSGFASVTGGDGDDTISSSGGNVTINSSLGTDTYRFGIGSGQMTLNGGWSGKSTVDTLELADGLSLSDLVFKHVTLAPGSSEGDLFIGIRGTADWFDVSEFFQGDDESQTTLQVRLADGTVVSHDQLLDLMAKSESWTGAGDSAVAAGLPFGSYRFDGYDVLFDRGDGKVAPFDPVSSDPNTPQPPPGGQGAPDGPYSSDDPEVGPLRLGLGIRPQDIALRASGESVTLFIKGTNDSIQLPGLLDPEVNGFFVNGVKFEDGTTWDLSTLLAHVEYGEGAGAHAGQVMTFPDSDQVLAPLGPNDTLIGADNETVQFGYGSGQMIVNLDSGGNVLQLGEGIRQQDIEIREGAGLQITLKSTGESVVLHDNQSAYDDPIDLIRFGDGSVWNRDNLRSMLDIGTPVELFEAHQSQVPLGIDTFITGVDDGTLHLGASDALVVIGDGFEPAPDTASTIYYGETGGNVTIAGSDNLWNEYLGSDAPDILKLGEGISLDNIRVSRTFDDAQRAEGLETTIFHSTGTGKGNLVVEFGETGKTVTIPYEMVRDTEGDLIPIESLNEIDFSDGRTVDPFDLILAAPVVNSAIELGRGDHTLTGGDGVEIHAAYGNTVALGTNQLVLSDGDLVGSQGVIPAQTTYLFNDETNGDHVVANEVSEIQFASDIHMSDIGFELGDDGSDIIFKKDTGAYITFKALDYTRDNIAAQVTFLIDGNRVFSSDPILNLDTIVHPDATLGAGYYADSSFAGQRVAYVRGQVTNAIFGGSAWATFDASSGDAALLDSRRRGEIIASAYRNPVTFRFDPNAGNAEIVNYDSGALNVSFSNGVVVGDVQVGEDGGNLLFKVRSANGDTKTLRVDNFYKQVSSSNSILEKAFTVSFADGTTWSDSDFKSMALLPNLDEDSDFGAVWLVSPSSSTVQVPGENQSILVKNDGQNTVSLGSAFVDASRGENTFLVSAKSQAYIENFDPSRNQVQFAEDVDRSSLRVQFLPNFTGPNESALEFIDSRTDKTILTIDNPDLEEDTDRVFHFADGLSWSAAQAVDGQPVSNSSGFQVLDQHIRGTDDAALLSGGKGDDVIAAGSAGDTIIGGGGNDTVFGGGGSDNFVFGHGFGNYTLVDDSPAVAGSSDTLSFKPDVSVGDVSVVTDESGKSETLILDSGESVKLVGSLDASGTTQAVTDVAFADGTHWSADDLARMVHQGWGVAGHLVADALDPVIFGGAGNDTIMSGNGNDTLVAGSGDDLIRGGSGNDVIVAGSGHSTIEGGLGRETYVFGSTFGNTTLIADGTAVNNRLEFIDTVMASDVSFSLSQEGNLVISLDSGRGTLILPNHVVDGSTMEDLNEVGFADGGTVGIAKIDELLAQSNGTSVHYVPDDNYRTSITQHQVIDLSATRPIFGTHGAPADYGPSSTTSDTSNNSSPGNASGQTNHSRPGGSAAGAGASNFRSIDTSMASHELKQATHARPVASENSPETSVEASQADVSDARKVFLANGGVSTLNADDLIPMRDGIDDRRLGIGAPQDRYAVDEQPSFRDGSDVIDSSARRSVGGRSIHEGRNGSRSLMAIRNASTANDLAKALMAGGRDALSDADESGWNNGAIRLQGGASWDLSSLDETMAALAPIGGSRHASGVQHDSDVSAELGHAQLVHAMASSSTSVSTASISTFGDDAVILAVKGH